MAVVTNEATRLKFGLILTAVLAIEAVITALLPGLPFLTAASIQAGLYVTFVTGKSYTDATYTKANGVVEAVKTTQETT